MENWLRTDETAEAVLALSVAVEHLPKVASEPNYWTWVIIPLHNALQGFMVLALRGTNGLGVLAEDCAANWMATYEAGGNDYPEPKLDTFLNLYRKTKSKAMQIWDISKPFVPRGSQGRSIKRLNALRNEVIHFVPKGWSVEVSGLPRIAKDCIATIEFLAFECGNVIWIEPDYEAKTRELLSQAYVQLDRLAEQYGA